METKFASAGLTVGQLNAIVKKLGGHDAALRFLRGELAVSKPVLIWREQDGVIYLRVTSNGRTGLRWIEHLERRGIEITPFAKSALVSQDFKPTNGVTTEVAVLKGSRFKEQERYTHNILAEGDKRGLVKPNAEVACLIREQFSDDDLMEMGLNRIVVMHKPVKVFDGSLLRLFANSASSLAVCGCHPNTRHESGIGFALAVSQDGPER